MPPIGKLTAAAAGAFIVLAFTVFRPPSTPGPLARDFEAYYAAGASVNAGVDPYSRAIWRAERQIPGVDARRDELLPFVGPAAALPFWSLLARLPYLGALVIWTAILIGSFVAIVLAALRIASATRAGQRAFLVAGVTISSAPMIGSLALGQAALVSAGAIAAAIVAYKARRIGAAFGATVLAALQPNLAVALAARLRSRWDLVVVAIAAGTLAALTLVAGGGFGGFAGYVQRLGAHGRAERYIAIQHTPAAVAYALGSSPQAAFAIGAGVALAAAGATVVCIVRERLDATTATLFACAALPLMIPFFHEPDFALEVLPVLVLALRSRGRPRGLAAVAAVLVLIDWFGFAQRLGAQGQIACLGLAVAFGFIALGPGAPRLRADFAGVLLLVLLTAIALPLGLTHPAPTWPDALPANYRADPTADASAVWADESRAAGLTRRDSVWGLLRSLPLVGCVVLAVALVADARSRRGAGPRPNVGTGEAVAATATFRRRSHQGRVRALDCGNALADGARRIRFASAPPLLVSRLGVDFPESNRVTAFLKVSLFSAEYTNDTCWDFR
jgi:hypothetical protein